MSEYQFRHRLFLLSAPLGLIPIIIRLTDLETQGKRIKIIKYIETEGARRIEEVFEEIKQSIIPLGRQTLYL